LITLSVNEARAFWFKVPSKADVITTMGKPSQYALDPNEIRLIVWNMYKAKKPSWEEDYFYLRENSDILVLQEAILNDKMTPVFKNDEDFRYDMATSFIYKNKNVRTGVITGSLARPKKVYAKKSKNREWVGLTPKAMLFTQYNISSTNKTLLVINIHAVNTVPWRILAKQLKQAGRKIKKHPGPVIFAGDFNTWNKNKTKFMKKYLQSIGMEEVQFPNGDDRLKFKLTNKILDYIWIKGLEYKDSYVWTELEGADHKAMSVTLRLED